MNVSSSRNSASLSGEREMYPASADGTSTADVDHPEGRPYPWLTDDEIVERMARATARLREEGEIFCVSDLPMSQAPDEEIDRRIEMAESGLKGWVPYPIDARIDGELADQLRVLDYLIENPTASIPPLWSLYPRPELWADHLVFDDVEHRST